jgi:hypothetical protein
MDASLFETTNGIAFHSFFLSNNIELEEFSQALAKATSLSYTAGIADFDGR